MPDDQSIRSSRGRDADRPGDIPATGWMDVAWRSWQEISDSNIFLIAGGVTYAVLLGLFPGLAALVSLYGLMLDPARIEQQMAALAGILPDQSRQMLADELHQLASASTGALGFGAIVALLFALWSASRGMSGLVTAINIAYEQKETRSFLRFNLIVVLLTLGTVAGGLIAIALIAVLPAATQFMNLGPSTRWVLLLVQWPLLIVMVTGGLAVLYRYAPNRDEPKWRWVSPGAITAAVLWIGGSIAFTVYVTHFGSYDRTYGSLGGAVILLTWLYLSAFAVLLGAVVNAQSERQTQRDTTADPPQSDAYATDSIGPGSNR